METTTSSLIETLKNAGMRITPQRIAICKLLVDSDSHPTAYDIFTGIRSDYPSLSLATVYNTLDVLVAQGVVNVLGHAGDGKAHFDACTTPHINLACNHCHKIVDMPSENVKLMDAEISRASGFDVVGARIMYYGICPDCQQKAANSNHLG